MKSLSVAIERFKFVVERLFALYRNRQVEFEYELVVCAIFKNEALYLDEWLSFHHEIGVDHFYLLNDHSDDDFQTVLEPWIDRKLVKLVNWQGGGQKLAYNKCIKELRMKARWIAFIDLDEFLFSPVTKDFKSVLRAYTDVPAIFVYWVLFGSSGHTDRPKGRVIDSYKCCMDFNAAINDTFDHGKDASMVNYVSGWALDGKSIVNPRLVREYNIHMPKSLWAGELVDENRIAPKTKGKGTTLSYSVFRINHYWSKSIQDITEKVNKGSVCNNRRPKRNLARWLERERQLNVSEDTVILDILQR
ncbi:MAG: glycosyltransferase family 92 protein [Methylotenera sp.]|uniref:glycosyltransferase family 92 protein n=1 Tax=Methylotenera sp. TaxID=2051956 RepID=UPI002723D175|nr:glycosyltransferase family 92 protein [Methylotenera sp.]MDO9150517.1 glycosyltransferase family 92 protein [Methylotenera sp.]